MAALRERVTDAAEPFAAPALSGSQIFCNAPSLRKSVSAPHLTSLDAGGMEVYVIQRPFVSFGAALFKRLPPQVNQLFVDVGVCHYMTVFRTPSGQLVQFDFGPRGGGDISLGAGDQGRMARLFRKNRSRVVPAEIREDRLATLPDARLFVGRTNLTLQQIRTFNEAQKLSYEVHASDCRHYVDRLVRYSTGTPRAAASTAKHIYELKRQKFRWTSGLTVCTDAMYYGHLKTAGQASLAMAAMLTNRSKLTRFWSSKLASPTAKALTYVPATSAMRHAAVRGARPHKPAAAAIWAEAPVIRNVRSLGEGVKRMASRGIAWMGDVARKSGGSFGAPEGRLVGMPFRRRQPALAITASHA